ncbi:hypothetical protein BpHYR1_023415 [Brachionus plicatilis]|uniref:Uncharacterized protein n=1 Tax=Brachionus plicatilis TaxID=10195 RepID=A0A3M7QZM5_BRAPC|nr:hypothetical protein BpHYR1_023415 [Brachionus plicatilis]
MALADLNCCSSHLSKSDIGLTFFLDDESSSTIVVMSTRLLLLLLVLCIDAKDNDKDDDDSLFLGILLLDAFKSLPVVWSTSFSDKLILLPVIDKIFTFTF